MPEPVSVGALERVLDSLGNPSQWSDVDARAGIRTPQIGSPATSTDVVTAWQQKLADDWGLPVLLVRVDVDRDSDVRLDWRTAPGRRVLRRARPV